MRKVAGFALHVAGMFMAGAIATFTVLFLLLWLFWVFADWTLSQGMLGGLVFVAGVMAVIAGALFSVMAVK